MHTVSSGSERKPPHGGEENFFLVDTPNFGLWYFNDTNFYLCGFID
jgi:hypothetical protein